MRGTYHPLLVALAVFVGVVGAFVAIDLFAHGGATRGRARKAWVAGGVLTSALAIWSVHFIGMLSLRIRAGTGLVPVGYDLPRMLLPIAVATVATGLAGAVIGRWGTGTLPRVGAGVVFGGAIVGAHYAAMLSIRVSAQITHSRPLVLASIGVATAGAIAVVTAAVRHIESPGQRVPHRLGAALLAGAVVAATHYTAIGAARFSAQGGAMRVEARQLLATDGVAAFVATVVLMILGFALLSVALDRRACEQRGVADNFSRLYHDAEQARRTAEESERRFRMLADTAPAMVWVSGPDGHRIFVGEKWSRFTGQASDPMRLDAWADALHPEDRARTLAVFHDAARTQRACELEYRVRRSDAEYCWVLDRGVPRLSEQGELLGYVGTCIDVTDRREAEEMQRSLLEAARVLAASLDFEAVLHRSTQLLVPRLADYCQVHLHGPDGSLSQRAAAHVDPTKTSLLEELGRRYQPDLDNPHSLIARAFSTTEPVLVETTSADQVREITGDPEVLRILKELSPTSWLVVPLMVQGHQIGTVTLTMSSSGRHFTGQDRTLAELFAARAALALENARLYTDLRRARDQAVRASQVEAQLMRTRLETLRAQLNPHFLFNALNTIAMLVRREANADALHGIVSLSDLLRRTLTEQGALQTPLRTELALLKSYIAIEQLRFRDRLRVSMDVSPEALEALLPGMLLQPLVENAIKHGIARHAEAGRIDVAVRLELEALVLQVCDDGPGFPEGWDPATSGGVGLANTRERLERLYAGAASFSARNRPQGGAVVTVRIPRPRADGSGGTV